MDRRSITLKLSWILRIQKAAKESQPGLAFAGINQTDNLFKIVSHSDSGRKIVWHRLLRPSKGSAKCVKETVRSQSGIRYSGKNPEFHEPPSTPSGLLVSIG